MRCIVQRKSDSLFLGKGGEHRKWVDDTSHARIFTNSGHARNALTPYIYRGDFTKPLKRCKACKQPLPNAHFDRRFDREGYTKARRDAFDKLYDIIPVQVNLGIS